MHMSQSIQILVFIHSQISLFIKMRFIFILQLYNLFLISLILIHKIIKMFSCLINSRLQFLSNILIRDSSQIDFILTFFQSLIITLFLIIDKLLSHIVISKKVFIFISIIIITLFHIFFFFLQNLNLLFFLMILKHKGIQINHR